MRESSSGSGSERSSYQVYTATESSEQSQSRPWASVLVGHLAKVNHLRQIFLAASIVLLSLLLAGCTTNLGSVKEIYLLSLSYQDGSPGDSNSSGALSSLFYGRTANASSLREVRSAYFGICATADYVSWLCDSSAADLAGALNATGHADSLNLVWTTDEFRAQAVTPILTFLAAVLTFLAFTLGMVYPVTINSSGKVSLRVAVTGITAVPSPRARFGAWLPTSLKRNATTFSLFFMALAAASTFTLAAWQHLAAACFTGLAEDLAFGAIVGHTGPVAAALAWLSFVCAALCTVLLGLEKGLRSKISKDEVPSMEAPGESRFGDGVESQLGQDATQLDPEEQPPLRNPDSWQQAPSIPLYHVLQFMGYTPTGRRGEWETRQQNTAAWVRRGEMSHGFAETIVEGEDE
ncbi:hypothetical protein JDV02_008391 [Purpureocillium takamizusanense]|uniref:Ca2+ regulator and membrane fusion protein Fig1-domain-containing protein n=1 Tax=Purpureocillium takamizusanense TaxID=2060973 RepID=A0A9Q8QQ75_9HYPO|nr:uncharacterized protein JDV02_008391 [Purpureocillium takamizusanense]UNI22507.1 hypothetical protein JDV02_008391 [Purpureocillium takamizusanense]